MSYIVKDNIPQNCAKCPQRTLYRGINVCIASGKMKVSSSNKNRHEKCPLVEIPTPHGRLIDADNLIKVLQDTLDNYSDNYNDGKTVEKLFVETCKQYIDHCPTIIEVEESE